MLPSRLGTKVLIETDGVHAALLWLATHSWFEGALEAIDRAPSAD